MATGGGNGSGACVFFRRVQSFSFLSLRPPDRVELSRVPSDAKIEPLRPRLRRDRAVASTRILNDAREFVSRAR